LENTGALSLAGKSLPQVGGWSRVTREHPRGSLKPWTAGMALNTSATHRIRCLPIF